jgi:polar amino acid transport system permease protein
VIPQVLRAVWHPMTNQFIWVMLLTSLGMLVGLRELSGETQFLNSRTFRTFEFFAVTALIYYFIAKLMLLLFRVLGWRLFRGG